MLIPLSGVNIYLFETFYEIDFRNMGVEIDLIAQNQYWCLLQLTVGKEKSNFNEYVQPDTRISLACIRAVDVVRLLLLAGERCYGRQRRILWHHSPSGISSIPILPASVQQDPNIS